MRSGNGRGPYKHRPGYSRQDDQQSGWDCDRGAVDYSARTDGCDDDVRQKGKGGDGSGRFDPDGSLDPEEDCGGRDGSRVQRGGDEDRGG